MGCGTAEGCGVVGCGAVGFGAWPFFGCGTAAGCGDVGCGEVGFAAWAFLGCCVAGCGAAGCGVAGCGTVGCDTVGCGALAAQKGHVLHWQRGQCAARLFSEQNLAQLSTLRSPGKAEEHGVVPPADFDAAAQFCAIWRSTRRCSRRHAGIGASLWVS